MFDASRVMDLLNDDQKQPKKKNKFRASIRPFCYYFTPETKEQSKEWVETDGSV